MSFEYHEPLEESSLTGLYGYLFIDTRAIFSLLFLFIFLFLRLESLLNLKSVIERKYHCVTIVL